MSKFYTKIIQNPQKLIFLQELNFKLFEFMYKEETEDVFSKPVRAGKRTYFFDVKTTRGQKDYYLTITESKRRTNPDGSFAYDKHKIFLYKEDFAKFQEGLAEVVNYIKDTYFGGEIPERPSRPEDEEEF